MTQFFGTDGIRGKTGSFPITPDFFVKIGYAAGLVLTKHHDLETNPSVVIGKDTRISGYMFESALESGFAAAGVDVYLTGPIPTPAIAFLTKSLNADIGVSITASHNPYDDNGIKLFSNQGTKLPQSIEREIEEIVESDIKVVPAHRLGKAKRLDDARDRYEAFCLSTVPKNFTLAGKKIILDCAHGATYQVAPSIFSRLGADIQIINNQPNGLNINENAGSIHPEFLIKAVLIAKADLGIAFDGDGDRLIMVDELGQLIDGDQILFLLLKSYLQQNIMSGGLVGTLMSNLALEEKCKEMNIPFTRAKVGDKYVAEALREKKWIIGGENSGHIVLLDKHSTGDGIISSLQLIAFLQSNQESLSQALSNFPMYPQKLINITSIGKFNADGDEVKPLIEQANEMMEGKGRVLIRESGTQPLIRVMTEGPDVEKVIESAQFLVDSINQTSQ
ncbi:MAG: phosphoglucosamine mutase [Nitrosomonadales bacterium]|nr:phosphoglucosamine mutase [Nitrosomonadales bacterium]